MLGWAYPVATTTVVVGTANHFILDAVAGVAVLLLGFAVQYLLSGHGTFTSPTDAPHLKEASSSVRGVEDLLDDTASAPSGASIVVDELTGVRTCLVADGTADPQ